MPKHLKNSCKIIVENGVPFLAMPDGTIIPEQTGLVIREHMEEVPVGTVSLIVEIELTAYVALMDTIEKGKHLQQQVEIKAPIQTIVPFVEGMQSGYFWRSQYYPLTGPVPKVMDREYAVMSIAGPLVVKKGDSLIKNENGEVTGIQYA